MSDIHALETNLDLKQNLNVYANCKQLDILHLVLNIFDDGVQADLSNYKVRLKAMKADKIPLIQDTEYSVVNNVVTIIAHEQLTTTSGTTKIELQFINKKTGEKKATFNLNLKVIANVLESERSISTATYTLLEELENKLDRAVDIAKNVDEAIEINKTLSTAINDAASGKSTLEIETAKGNVLKTNLAKNITDGNIINTTLENSITTGNKLKTDIDTKNIQAESNIKAMESFEDVTKLTQIVAGHTTQLLDKANNIDSSRTTTSKTVTGAINELNANKANKDGTMQSNLNADMLDGRHVSDLTQYFKNLTKDIFQNANYISAYTGSLKTDGTVWGTPNDSTEQYYQVQYFPNGVTQNGYGTQVLYCYFGVDIGRIFQRFSNGTTWGSWKKVATSEVIDLTLLNGWVAYAGGFELPRAIKVGNTVSLHGVIKSGTSVIAQLPVGLRPLQVAIGIVMTGNSNNIGRIDVNVDGSIASTFVNNSWVSLDGVTFYVQ